MFIPGVWCPDGTIIFSTGRSGETPSQGLSRVRIAGGTPEVLTTVDHSKRERSHLWPALLPDGKHLLFTIVLDTDIKSRIAVLSLETGEYETVLDNASQPFYSPTGHLVHDHDRSDKLFAVAFDPRTRRVTGEPVEIDSRASPQVVISKTGNVRGDI